MSLFGYKAVILLLNVWIVNSSMLLNDCHVTTWTEWSLSGQYTESRSRKIIWLPSGGVSLCPPLCETREIKADCKVSEWSEWGGNFGFGQQFRTRNVTQNPIGTGNKCPNLIENRYIDITPTVIETAKNVEQYFIRPKYNPNRNPGERRLLVRRETNQGNVRDLLLIMDSSGSIGWSNFHKANKEISTLIGLLCPENPFEKVNGQYQYNQAAMLTFSTTVHQHFDFDDYATTEDIQGAISKAMYYGGGTNTAEAFIQAIGMFKSSNGYRNSSEVKPEVLIFTDGQSNNRQQTLQAVEELRKVADVYGLMIGGFTEQGKDELTAYVSAPINEHLFYVESYTELEALVKYLSDEKKQAGAWWCAPFNVG